MIAEIALTIVNLALVGLHLYSIKQEKQEKRKLINALIAKDAMELRDLELADASEPVKARKEKPDLVLESALPDEEFKKVINGEQIS